MLNYPPVFNNGLLKILTLLPCKIPSVARCLSAFLHVLPVSNPTTFRWDFSCFLFPIKIVFSFLTMSWWICLFRIILLRGPLPVHLSDKEPYIIFQLFDMMLNSRPNHWPQVVRENHTKAWHFHTVHMSFFSSKTTFGLIQTCQLLLWPNNYFWFVCPVDIIPKGLVFTFTVTGKLCCALLNIVRPN